MYTNILLRRLVQNLVLAPNQVFLWEKESGFCSPQSMWNSVLSLVMQ